MHMKTAGFFFAAILSAVIMFGTVMAAANAGVAAASADPASRVAQATAAVRVVVR